MSDLLQYVDLPRHSLNISFILDPVFLQNFYRNFFASDCVRADSYFSEGSGSEWSS